MKRLEKKSENSGSEQEQSKKFIDMARELGVDEGDKAFDDNLRRIVPKPEPKEEAPE